MKKAIIYARYSSSGQTEQSIEGQLTVCNEYAKRNGYVIVDTYIDRAKTAKNDNRPHFQQMMHDSSKKNFQYIIVYKMDRFARSRFDTYIDRAILMKNGVKVVSATEQISDTPEGILMDSVLVGIAEYYSAELSQKVKRGQRESINKKNFLGGSVLYGYYIDNKKLVVNEEEAAIVREIFTSYASGKTADEIVADLKKRNIKNRHGRYFCKNSIFNMLKNKRYLGMFKYGEYQVTDYNPAIIDENLYNLCAEKVTRRKRSIEKFEFYGDYVLSGKLYCGECREKMHGESGTSMTGKIYYYYKCSNRKKNLGCMKKNISRDYLEDLVMAITIDNLLKEDIVLDLVDKIIETYNNELGEDKELSILRKQLTENERFIANILNAIKNGIFSESTQAELVRLEKEKTDILSSIAIRESKAKKPIEREQVLFFLKQFANDKKAISKSDMAKIVNLLIEMIILWNDRIIIIFKNGSEPDKPLKIDDVMDSLVREKSNSVHHIKSQLNYQLRFLFVY